MSGVKGMRWPSDDTRVGVKLYCRIRIHEYDQLHEYAVSQGWKDSKAAAYFIKLGLGKKKN